MAVVVSALWAVIGALARDATGKGRYDGDARVDPAGSLALAPAAGELVGAARGRNHPRRRDRGVQRSPHGQIGATSSLGAKLIEVPEYSLTAGLDRLSFDALVWRESSASVAARQWRRCLRIPADEASSSGSGRTIAAWSPCSTARLSPATRQQWRAGLLPDATDR